MKNLVYFLVIVFAQNVFSQELPYYLMNENEVFEKQFYVHETHKHEVGLKEYVPIEKRNYDVLHYNLYMDWYYLLARDDVSGMNTYDGINEIKIEIVKDNVDKIDFDFDDQTIMIDSVFVNGVSHQNYFDNSNILSLMFDNSLKKGDTLDVKMYYRYSSGENEGLIFVDKNVAVDFGPPPGNDTIYTEARLAYTMSQPIDARKWMPCNDYPYDKSTARISVKVPKGFMVASNGMLINKVEDDKSVIFVWESQQPITTYLMAAHASEYSYFYDWYYRVSNPQDSIKMEYYVWESDFKDTSTDGMSYNAHYAFRNTVKMMEFFSTIYGEYPYDKYGQVVVQPAWFSGMEHQTITTLVRNILRVYNAYGQNRDYSNQTVIAHEMSHQWLGDYITCASWNDIWINEGGATWSENLWHGRNDENVYYDGILNRINTFFWLDDRRTQGPIYGPSIDNVFNYATTYVKAGIFYHMLSEALGGREKFFELLRSMMKHYAYQSISTEDFKNYLKSQYSEEDSPIDFDKFFEQWIYKAGYPIFNVRVNTKTVIDNSKYETELELEQLQSGEDVPDTYEMPMWIKFVGANGDVVYDSVYVSEKLQKFKFTLPFMPAQAVLDTSKVLMRINEEIMSVRKSNETISGISQVYPNPARKGEVAKLKVNITNVDNITIELINLIGVKEGVIFSGVLLPGNYEFDISSSKLSSGNYFVKILSSNDYTVRKFTVIN